MMQFLQFILIPGLAAGMLALLGAAALRWRSPGRAERRGVLLHLGITLALLAADWALLAALPALNLSYGVVQFPLLTLLGLRLLLFVGWEWGKRLGPLMLALNLLLTGLVVYAFYVEPFTPSVTHLTLPAPGAGLTRPVRIVQLSDIHLEHPTRREADVLRQIQTLQPDLIMITGDFLNTSFLYNPQSEAELHDWLANLNAPAGVWAVSGNTDSPDMLRRIFSGTAVKLLDDAVQRVDVGGGQLALLGVTDINLDRDGQKLAALLGGLRADEFSLLLYHNPGLIGSARKRNVDLYLTGHTHGGQVRLPIYGALVTNSAFGKQFEMGLYYQLNTTLYVNRGLGMEGSIAPRARLLCPPEIVVIDLQAE